MYGKSAEKDRTPAPKVVLRLPDLEQSKSGPRIMETRRQFDRVDGFHGISHPARAHAGSVRRRYYQKFLDSNERRDTYLDELVFAEAIPSKDAV